MLSGFVSSASILYALDTQQALEFMNPLIHNDAFFFIASLSFLFIYIVLIINIERHEASLAENWNEFERQAINYTLPVKSLLALGALLGMLEAPVFILEPEIAMMALVVTAVVLATLVIYACITHNQPHKIAEQSSTSLLGLQMLFGLITLDLVSLLFPSQLSLVLTTLMGIMVFSILLTGGIYRALNPDRYDLYQGPTSLALSNFLDILNIFIRILEIMSSNGNNLPEESMSGLMTAVKSLLLTLGAIFLAFTIDWKQGTPLMSAILGIPLLAWFVDPTFMAHYALSPVGIGITELTAVLYLSWFVRLSHYTATETPAATVVKGTPVVEGIPVAIPVYQQQAEIPESTKTNQELTQQVRI
ncbi:MAG: hypothetical protein CMF51_01180 [Legionellales bacterium]|nr:hypothetical protein [Legionellales bacterium]